MTVAAPGAATARTPSGPARAGLVVGRNIRRMVGPGSVFGAVVIPLVFLVGFWALLGRLLAARGIEPGQHLVPGVVVQAGMFTAMSAGFAMSADRTAGITTRLRTMSVGWGAVLGGRLGADALRGLVSLVVVVLAGSVLGFRFAGPLSALGFVVVATAFTLCLATGAAALGASSDSPESVNAVLQIPYLPLIMLSSAFVPAEAFPGWIEPVIGWSPVTVVVDTLRALAGGTGGDALVRPLLGAVGWIVVLGTVFVLLFRRSMRGAAVGDR